MSFSIDHKDAYEKQLRKNMQLAIVSYNIMHACITYSYAIFLVVYTGPSWVLLYTCTRCKHCDIMNHSTCTLVNLYVCIVKQIEDIWHVLLIIIKHDYGPSRQNLKYLWTINVRKRTAKPPNENKHKQTQTNNKRNKKSRCQHVFYVNNLIGLFLQKLICKFNGIDTMQNCKLKLITSIFTFCNNFLMFCYKFCIFASILNLELLRNFFIFIGYSKYEYLASFINNLFKNFTQ